MDRERYVADRGKDDPERMSPQAYAARKPSPAHADAERGSTQGDEISALLDQLGAQPGYAELLRVGNQLLKRLPPGDLAPSQQVRIALASSFTINPLAAALAVECHRIGLWPVTYLDGFNLYASHILDANSPLYQFRPDIVFLGAELDSITPVGDRFFDQGLVEETCRRLKGLVDTFKKNSLGSLVVHNFATPSRFPFAITDVRPECPILAVNAWLADTYRTDPQVRVLDFERLCAYHGKTRVTNPKLHYLGGIEVSESFLPVLARQYLAYIRALKGLTRKCLAVDLDGCLWGGVVGEDLPDGIRLARHGQGSEYRDFQNTLLELNRRGVILAINSKNNPADALEVLRNHPDMVLREKHFGSIQINWNDKASNLRAIAEELNIGLDTIIFVDDNPVERAWVRQSLPEVKVVDLPDDPTLYARAIEELTDFEVVSLTEEDRLRGASYAAERSRRNLKAVTTTFEEFVAGLGIVLTVGVALPQDLARVAQLTRKTNQFNMTTRRYTDAEIADMASRDNALIYTLRVRDTFGEYGLVGVALLKQHQAWKIDVFLMSCRVLGRTIEVSFLDAVLSDATRRGVSLVEAEFIPTAKNSLAAHFYQDFGFDLVSEKDGRSLWRLSLAGWSQKHPDLLAVEWENATIAER